MYDINSKGNHVAKNLVGMTFNRLTVVEKACNTKSGNAQWKCKCSCGNYTVVQSYKLRNGLTKSCGCLTREIAIKTHSRSNTFKIVGEVVYAKDTQGKEFIFDLDQLEKVKKYYWSVTPKGYVKNVKHRMFLHRYLLNSPKELVTDHKNHITTDNRLCNIVACTQSENMFNQKRFHSK